MIGKDGYEMFSSNTSIRLNVENKYIFQDIIFEFFGKKFLYKLNFFFFF